MAVEIVIGANTKQADQAVNKLKSNVASIGNSGGGASAAFDKVSGALAGVARVAGVVGAAISVAFALKTITDFSDLVTTLENKLRGLEVPDLGASLTNVYAIAERTRSTVSETADLYSRILRSTRELQLNEAAVARLTETIQKGFKLAGASAQEAGAASLQIAQALASGVLQGDELRSILENAPALATAIAKQLGVSVGELRKMGSEGKITSAVLVKALLGAGVEIDTAFAKTAATISDTFKTEFEKIKVQIGNIFNDTNAPEKFVDIVKEGFEVLSFFLQDWYTNTISPLIDAIKEFYNALDNLFKRVTGGISIFEAFKGGLIIVYRYAQIFAEGIIYIVKAFAILTQGLADFLSGNFKEAGQVFNRIGNLAVKTGEKITGIISGTVAAGTELDRFIEKQRKADQLESNKPNAPKQPPVKLTNDQLKGQEDLQNKVNSYLGTQDKYLAQANSLYASIKEAVDKYGLSAAKAAEYTKQIAERTKELRENAATDALDDLRVQAGEVSQEYVFQLRTVRQINAYLKDGTYNPKQAEEAKRLLDVILAKQKEIKATKVGDFLDDLRVNAGLLTKEYVEHKRLLREINQQEKDGDLSPAQAAEARTNLELKQQIDLRKKLKEFNDSEVDIRLQIETLTNNETPGLRERVGLNRTIDALLEKFPERQKEILSLQGQWTKALEYSLSEAGKLEKKFESDLSQAIYNGLAEGENFFKSFANAIGRSILKTLTDDIASTITKAVFKGFKDGDAAAQNPISTLIKGLSSSFDKLFQDIAAKLAASLSGNAFGGIFSSFLSSGFGSGLAFGNQDLGQFLADGGPAKANTLNVVGERGPELFIPNTNGNVISNESLQQGLGGGGTSVTYNINAIDSKSFQQMLAENPQTIYAASVYGQKTFQSGRLRG